MKLRRLPRFSAAGHKGVFRQRPHRVSSSLLPLKTGSRRRLPRHPTGGGGRAFCCGRTDVEAAVPHEPSS